jgi:hypothetical protein
MINPTLSTNHPRPGGHGYKVSPPHHLGRPSALTNQSQNASIICHIATKSHSESGTAQKRIDRMPSASDYMLNA